MSKLKEVLSNLTESESKLFDGQYSSITHEFYEPETDEINESITGMDGNTQQVFTLQVAALRNHGRLVDIYKVQVRYFDMMKAEAAVPGPQLLDFLLHARLVVSNKPSVSFVYEKTLL